MPAAAEVTVERLPPLKAGPKPRKKSQPFLESYRTFCYRTFGAGFDRGIPNAELEERLKQSGVNATPGMYRSVLLVTSLIALAVSAVGAFFVFWVVIRSPIWFVWVAIIAGIGVGATVAGFQFLLTARVSNRRDLLERELPFTLSELSVLASTGVPPIELMRRMARRDHDPAMTKEFQKVVYKVDVQGKDLILALTETARESASNSLREAFWDLANMIHQGGDMDEYLRSKSDEVLLLKRSVQKDFIERLSTFLDMYVTLVLMGVLMIAVGAFLLNSFGSTVAGLDANVLLLLLTFGLVPVAVAMTTVLIQMAWSRVE